MDARVEHSGAIELLNSLPENSIDAAITDPPYELNFMNQSWDRSGIAFDPTVWAAVLRALKPGGQLLSFGGARTYHRIACAIEDAGFEIRDQIMWVFGTGLPKSRNLHGAWQGWGSSLKPGHEPVCLARKPFKGTIEKNVLTWGTGALNIDACRVEHVTVGDGNLALNPHLRTHINGGNGGNIFAHEAERRVVTPNQLGRFPANFVHDGSDEVLELFPADAPSSSSGSSAKRDGEASAQRRYTEKGSTNFAVTPGERRFDTGSAARFFYCAKPSRKERDLGMIGTKRNNHVTVKPLALMRWLVRMITQPNGIVLDPFVGSGTTGMAAALEGHTFIGGDNNADYIDIAKARIDWAIAEAGAHAAETL